MVTEVGLSQMSASLPELFKLNLECCNVTFHKVTAIGFPRLSALNLCCSNVRDAGMSNISQTSPALVMLDLSSCDISESGLREVMKLLQLSHLDLSGCASVADPVLKLLAQQLLELSHLGLGRCGKVTDSGVRQLQKMPKLTSLDLSRCTKVTWKCKAVFGPHVRLLY
jgi:hypothetical protein